MHVMWNRGKWKSPLFQILALLASRRRSDRPCRVLRTLLQFSCNLSVFYDFIFCIIIWFFGLYSLYNLFCPALVVCQSLFIFAFKTVPIFLFFCARPFGCVEPNRWLHSGWHFRGYLLKHRFRSAQNIKFDYTDNAQLQPFYKRAFIESLPAGKPTGAAVDSCCTL